MQYSKAVVLLLTLALSSMLYARDFHWAGVGFLGDYDQIHKLYPYSAAVFDRKECNGHSCFEKHAREVFANQSVAGGEIVFTEADKGSDAVGVALAIGYERLIVEKTPKNKASDKNVIHTAVIFGNLLFMNLDTNSLVGSVPTYITYTTAGTSRMKEADVRRMFRKLLVSNDLNINFADEALKRAKTYSLPIEGIRRSQIVSVETNDNAARTMGQTSEQTEELNLAMASIFEGSLTKETETQMFPSNVGHVVGGKLKTRLESGDREIGLFKPDVKFHLNLEKAKRYSKPKKGGYAETICHATRLSISVEDSFDDTIFRQSLLSLPCRVYVTGSQLDDAIVFEKSLFSLLARTAKAIKRPKESQKFIKKACPKDTRAALKSFIALRDLLRS